MYADGKNNLTVRDQNGQDAETIALESDYSPYGWFTDDYLLVSKSSSELHVMAADGSGQAFKISNYYKPQVSYRGYGGGYGGLWIPSTLILNAIPLATVTATKRQI